MLNQTIAVQSVSLAAPLILAAMGGYTSERCGVINIALEGKMLTAACVAAVVTQAFGPFVGLVTALVAAILLSLLHWLATQHYGIDHVISGMAVNAFALGGTDFAYKKWGASGSDTALGHFPTAAFYLIAIVSPFLLWAFTKYARSGWRMVAVGSDPDKSRLAGIEPLRVRLLGLIATGVFTGLAGTLLFSELGGFSENMTAGKGYIALAALILGGWRPLPAMAAAVVFGFFSAVQLSLQGTALLGATIPSQAWSALPYLVTIVAMAGFIGKNRTPGGLGKA